MVFSKNFVVILIQRKTKTNKILWSSEDPVATDRQRKCDTISGRISCLAPNFRVNNIESIEDTFHLYFDNDIIGKIVDCANTKINETITRLQQSDKFNASSVFFDICGNLGNAKENEFSCFLPITD